MEKGWRKLSTGQRQCIAIGRGFLKSAPITELDEARFALNSEIETAIQESLDLFMHSKTISAIARLPTSAALDRLIVMDQGRVREEGAHAALLAQSGVNAELWAQQSSEIIAPVMYEV